MDCYECIVCYFSYDNDQHKPFMVNCGHTFCMFCLNRIQKYKYENKRICPKCRQQITGSNVNYALLTLSRISRKDEDFL